MGASRTVAIVRRLAAIANAIIKTASHGGKAGRQVSPGCADVRISDRLPGPHKRASIITHHTGLKTVCLTSGMEHAVAWSIGQRSMTIARPVSVILGFSQELG